MMFRVGQLVVCVAPADILEKGRIYTVSAIGAGYATGAAMLQTEETRAYGTTPYPWYADRFRPVKDTSIEIFRRLVAPIEGEKVRA
jgi:hypothetical protein